MQQPHIMFTAVDANGRVMQRGTTMHVPDLPGLSVVLGEIAPDNTYRQDGRWVPIPESPDPSYTFDWVSKQWIDPITLEDRRAARWRVIKAARAQHIAAGVDVPGIGRFDSDPEAQGKLTATVAMLDAMPESFTIEWTLFDNTVATLTKDDVRAAAMAVFLNASEAHSTAQTLRAALDAATSREEVEAVTWPT